MISPHLLKLRARRYWRRNVAQTLAVGHGAGELFEKSLLGRLNRLRFVWRFVLVWMLVMVVLGAGLTAQIVSLRSYYQEWKPVSGGRFTEGIAGTFTTANPLYAVSDVDTAVARLLFAGLLKYDDHNNLVGDLAESWSVDPSGKIYTVRLRPNLVWSDEQPLTSADVVYTYRTIQNSDARSPLLPSWQNVTVRAIDDRVITFALPNPLASFPSGLTNGIVPKHVLESVNPVDLRSIAFDTSDPIGAGPFKLSSVGVSGIGAQAKTQITLVPSAHYWAGEPKLTSLTLYSYADKNAMIQAYIHQELSAIAGLDEVPAQVGKDPSSHVYNLPLTAGVYVFFKTSDSSSVLGDAKVRQALVLASNRAGILKSLNYPSHVVDEPLLADQLGYDATYAQVTNQLEQAKAILDGAGWRADSHGLRSKDGRPLSFTLSISDLSEYRRVANQLRSQWRAVGADVQVVPQPAADFQGALSQHGYEAVLYGISLGVDPDVFVYWDSSQNDPRSATRLNFSEYKSSAADLALEAGRTRLDPQIRAAKYHTFLKAWQESAPALALYQPRFLYISHVPIYGLASDAPINTDADRYRNVQNWMVDMGWVPRP